MQHRSVRIRLLVSVVGVLAAGCDPIVIDHNAALEARATSLAEAYCAVYQACDCEPLATDAVYPDPEQCVSKEKTRLLAAFEQAESKKLEFDHDCMDQLLARYSELGCEDRASLHLELGNPALSDSFGCALYHGNKTDRICEGAVGTSWSDCAAGQRCVDNACYPTSTLVPQGQACWLDYTEFAVVCAPGLYCSGKTNTREPFIAAGEPCVGAGSIHDVTRCAPDHHCEPLSDDTVEGTCQPLMAAGEPCSSPWGGTCSGWCLPSDDSEDPTVGVCTHIPAVCLYEDLRPPT
jgi:hypothetical protein